MASTHYTILELVDATHGRKWDEVRQIIRTQPTLVNEIHRDLIALNRIVLYEAPQDFLLEIFEFAEEAAVDAVEPRVNRSILHQLARHGHEKVLARALSISSKHVNLQDWRGETPLHILLRKNFSFNVHYDAAKALLNVGADINLKNQDGVTPVSKYSQNDCEQYHDENKQQQKEDLIRLLRRKIIPAEILARGPGALKAFIEARKEGETEVNQGRTIFIGLERVGKSSTINSFLRKDFNPDEEMTDAMATTKVYTQDADDETLWEEASQDISGAAEIYENALVEAMVKQVLESELEEEPNAPSTENGEKSADETIRRPKGSTGMKRLFRSFRRSVKLPKLKNKNKTAQQKQKSKLEAFSNYKTEPDSEISQEKLEKPQKEEIHEEIPEEIARKVEKRMNEVEFTRGATTSSNWQPSGNTFVMNIWDFGGQPIYHVIQRIFMVSFAVVCVVFNLNDDLDAPANVRDPTTGKIYKHRMTNLQFILYWIRSVYTNSRDLKLDDDQLSPPVLLIGTHLDSIEGNEEEKKQKLDEILNKIWKALEGKPYEAMVSSIIFTIENSQPFATSNASQIMTQILKYARKMISNLPIKWLLVQQEIQKFKEKHIYLPTSEVFDLLDRCGVNRNQRVLLEYLHDLGEILYFPDDEALNSIIVLDLMRLVDMFKTIITVKDPKLQKPIFRRAWRKLDSGILVESLLRHLWKKFCVSDKTFNFFVALMQQFGLVCEKKSIKDDERIFYVLSRLKPIHIDSLPAEDYGKRAISLFHDFGSYLPDDLFQRAATKFIERFQMEDVEPKLSYEHVALDIDGHHQVVLDVATIKHRRMFQTTMTMHVIDHVTYVKMFAMFGNGTFNSTTIIRRKILNTDRSTNEDEPLPSICKEVLSFLEKELKIFCQSGARGVELKMYIPCVCSPNMKDAHMHIVRKFDKDVLPCGSNAMEVTHYRKLFGETVPQHAILPPQPEVNKPKGYVDDVTIAKVSEEINLSWRRFGVRLGLSWSKVNNFYANETQKEKAVKDMLKHWRSNIDGEKNQLEVLCTALRQHKLNSLADAFQDDDTGNETPVITKQAECFDDQDLLFICNNLGSGWRRLAVRLGIEWSNINDITENNRHVKDSIMEVLVMWRDCQSTNQKPIMIDSLRQHGLVGLAERMCTSHGCEDQPVAGSNKDAYEIQSKFTLVQGQLTDLDFLMISEMMDGDWRSFCRCLQIADVELTEVQRKYPTQIVESTLETLVRWRGRQGSNVDQLTDVKRALIQMKKMNIVEKLETRKTRTKVLN